MLLLSCPGTTLSALIPQALQITCSILPDAERSVEAESTCCQPPKTCPIVHCNVSSLSVTSWAICTDQGLQGNHVDTVYFLRQQ